MPLGCTTKIRSFLIDDNTNVIMWLYDYILLFILDYPLMIKSGVITSFSFTFIIWLDDNIDVIIWWDCNIDVIIWLDGKYMLSPGCMKT
jgi:hypothetical protein